MRKLVYLFMLASLITSNAQADDNLFIQDDALVQDLYDVVDGKKKFDTETKEEMEARLRAEYEARMRRMGRGNTKSAEEIRAEKAAKKARERAKFVADNMMPIKLGNWHLKSIMLLNPSNWVLWVNDHKVQKSSVPEGWEIIYMRKDDIVMAYQNPRLKHFDSYFAGKMTKVKVAEGEKAPYWQYESTDKDVLVNVDEGIIRVTLGAREQFVGHLLKVVGRSNLVENELSINHPEYIDPLATVSRKKISSRSNTRGRGGAVSAISKRNKERNKAIKFSKKSFKSRRPKGTRSR